MGRAGDYLRAGVPQVSMRMPQDIQYCSVHAEADPEWLSIPDREEVEVSS